MCEAYVLVCASQSLPFSVWACVCVFTCVCERESASMCVRVSEWVSESVCESLCVCVCVCVCVC